MQPLIQNNIELFTKRVEDLTASIAIEKGSQISLLKANSEAFVNTALQLLVEDVLIHYNSLEKVLDPIRKRIVKTILGKYWWMKLEEIAYVFNQGKSGVYGRSNKNISPDTFMDWLNNYDLNEREQYCLNQNKELQKQENKILSDEELKEFYKKAQENRLSDSPPDGSQRINERKESSEEFRKAKIEYIKNKPNQEEIRKQIDNYKVPENELHPNRSSDSSSQESR